MRSFVILFTAITVVFLSSTGFTKDKWQNEVFGPFSYSVPGDWECYIEAHAPMRNCAPKDQSVSVSFAAGAPEGYTLDKMKKEMLDTFGKNRLVEIKKTTIGKIPGYIIETTAKKDNEKPWKYIIVIGLGDEKQTGQPTGLFLQFYVNAQTPKSYNDNKKVMYDIVKSLKFKKGKQIK